MLLKIAGTLGLFFVLYLGYYWWDMRNLRAFCDEVKTDMPVTALPQLAEHHNLNSRYVTGDGVFREEKRFWSYYVPSNASVGSNVCANRHDKVKVISAELQYD